MGSSLCLKGVHAHWDLSVGEFVKGNSSVTLGGRGWKRTVSTEIAGFCMIFRVKVLIDQRLYHNSEELPSGKN